METVCMEKSSDILECMETDTDLEKGETDIEVEKMETANSDWYVMCMEEEEKEKRSQEGAQDRSVTEATTATPENTIQDQVWSSWDLWAKNREKNKQKGEVGAQKEMETGQEKVESEGKDFSRSHQSHPSWFNPTKVRPIEPTPTLQGVQLRSPLDRIVEESGDGGSSQEEDSIRENRKKRLRRELEESKKAKEELLEYLEEKRSTGTIKRPAPAIHTVAPMVGGDKAQKWVPIPRQTHMEPQA